MVEAQVNRRTCGAMDEHRRLLIENPSYAAARSEIETMARVYERGARMSERIGVTRIPVVVHVVWNTAAQNISDAQIQSQIDVLNQDFRRGNADIAQVPQVWQSVAADARIEFALATTDPNGNLTNGITRTQTQIASFSQPQNNIKSAATGGADPWPADRYLNVWVAPDVRNSQGQSLLGYAQFPGGPDGTDGVVILHSAFGTAGTVAAPFDRGRTATHEIGHWLNCFHIWGDDGTGCNGTDEAADTPNQGGPNFGCPTFPSVSCNNGPNGDMFMNYMDYTDDACMFMFTAGQVARMQATLDGPRSSIGSQVSGWSDWGGLGGVLFSDPVVTNNADGRLEVFVRGTDNRLYHKWQTAPNDGWVSDWGSLDGVLDGNIAVGRNADGRLEVFVRGTDNALYNRWQTAPNNGWSADWGGLGGVLDGNVAVGRNADGRLEVFVRGTDNALYHKWQTAPNNGWSDWSSLGGVLVGNVAVSRNADGRLEVFVRGTDNALYHRWQTAPNNGWSDWSSLGGVIFSDPMVASNADGRLEVFVRGTDNALYHKWQTAPNNGWSDWASLGGVLNGNVAVSRNADGRLEVFVRGTDNALYHKWQTG